MCLIGIDFDRKKFTFYLQRYSNSHIVANVTPHDISTNVRSNSAVGDQFLLHLQNRFLSLSFEDLGIFQDSLDIQDKVLSAKVNEQSVISTIHTPLNKIQGSNLAPTI